MGDHIVGTAVAVLPHRLVDLGDIFDGARQRRQHIDLACGDALLHFGKLARRIQVRTADLCAGHDDAALTHPYLRRIEGKTLPAQFLGVDHFAHVGFDQRGGEGEAVATRALEHHIRQAALVESVAQEGRNRRTNRLQRAVREQPHGLLKRLRLSERVGHLRKRPGRVVVITQSSLDLFETHHAFHLSTEAEGVHKFTLWHGIHENRDLRAALAAHFNRFDRHAVDNAILGTGSVND